MDVMTFWLIGLAFMGITGAAVTFARRYQNKQSDAGYAVAGWTMFFIFLWLILGAKLINSTLL